MFCLSCVLLAPLCLSFSKSSNFDAVFIVGMHEGIRWLKVINLARSPLRWFVSRVKLLYWIDVYFTLCLDTFRLFLQMVEDVGFTLLSCVER